MPKIAKQRRVLAGVALGTAAAVGIGLTVALQPEESQAADPAPFAFAAVADSFVKEAAPTANFSSARYVTTNGITKGRKRAYLKFNVSGLPTGTQVKSATLELNAVTAGSSVFAYAAKTNAWTEQSLTWANQPYWNTTPLGASATAVAGKPTVLNLGSMISGNGTYSVAVVMKNGVTGDAIFRSRETGTAGPKVKVAVTTASGATATPTATATAKPSATATATASPTRTTTPTATATPTATKTVTTAPATNRKYPNVASVQPQPGESEADACLRTMTYGFTGCVHYLPSGKLPAWDTYWRTLAAKAGDRPLDFQLTAKTHNDAGLAEVLTNLPAAWKAGFIYNIYQEPEDNLFDAASQKAYRDAYTAAAKVTRRFGVQLPWVEWQEWTINPYNNKGWDLANFTPPAADFGGVLWSFYEYNEKDRIDEQIRLVKGAMAKYAPGKPWALMAAGFTLEGNITDAKKQAQAAWLERAYKETRANGSVGFAWFNWLWPGTGGAGGEARVELNPYAMEVMRRLG